MRKKKTLFDESACDNNNSYFIYLKLLAELSISMFEWQGLPDTVDIRFLELMLFEQGKVVFFEDEVVGMLALCSMDNGPFDAYGIPTKRRAYSLYNSYQKDVGITDSVLCYNNMLRSPSYLMCQMFAKRLYNLDRIVDVNCNAQKTPVMVQGNEKQRLTLINLYQKYEGNEPFIFGDDSMNMDALKALNTGAPFVADRIYTLKTQIWNEAMTYLGIPNINTQKKERMITDEVTRNQGGVIANRYSRLFMRQQACEQINKMFGLNASVEYREMTDPLVDEPIKDEDQPMVKVMNDLLTKELPKGVNLTKKGEIF